MYPCVLKISVAQKFSEALTDQYVSSYLAFFVG